MLRLILSWTTFSLLLGCQSVKRPDADVCGVNAPGSKLHCYNILKDFSSDGIKNAGAVAHDKPVTSLHDLNGGIFVSAPDFEKMKVWITDLRNAYTELEKRCAQ